MTTQLKVNGAVFGNAVSPPLPDPIVVIWQVDGEPGRTHSGALTSMAWSKVILRWFPLYRQQYDALMDFYKSLVSGGAKITSLTVLDEHYSDLTTWTLYNQTDSRGMWPRKPTAEVDADQGSYLIRNVEWVIEHVKPSEL